MSLRFFRIWLLMAGAVFGAFTIARPALASQSGNVPNSSTEGRSDTILILPFENYSRIPTLDWLGEGLSEISVERLQDKGLNVLSRQERLAVLEKIGLPDSARFSHATMVKIAGEADADDVIFGKFTSDGNTVTLEANLLHISPPRLSSPLKESGALSDLLRIQARLSWKILCVLNEKSCPRQVANRDETTFTEPPPSLRPEVLEAFIHGLTGPNDDLRLRALRDAARLEPAWDRPAFELARIYFSRHDCEVALPWFSHVPPDRPDGPEASFDTGICHLYRNDSIRAEATFTGLLERAHSENLKDRIPELPEVHNNLGVARMNLGKWNEAAIEFERAAAMDDGEADFWVNLAIAKLAQKQQTAAVSALEHARKIDPQDKGARALLISTLESLGRGSEAGAVRTESPETSSAAPTPLPQDVADLAHLGRLSKEFDRSGLRSPSDVASGQTPQNKETHKPASGGGLN
ncbi:MAG TPA: tetratricopeptide repeat protein, partial [Candidatus Acidoferrales bacterium]|jgi:tetratricopeptide (TPR) repeat protein|nr:tetratricopeptide repeat protein [Candidatus Acidoferrales bacterium]